ncbi:MAG: minor capsid protein [Bradymonadaceae bacterium]
MPKIVKADPVQHPRRIEDKYAGALKASVVTPMRRLVDKHVFPVLDQLKDKINRRADSVHDPVYHYDSLKSDLERLRKSLKTVQVEFAGERSKEQMRKLAQKFGADVESYNGEEMTEKFSQVLGVEPTWNSREIQRKVKNFADENLSLITEMPEEIWSKMRSDLVQGFREGKRWEQLRQTVQDKLEVGDYRAELIARDQVGKLHGNLTETRNKQLGVERYEWQTSRDERVRDAHRIKHGEKYRWDSPPPDTGHPGQDIQCRCDALAIVSDVLKAQEAGRFKAADEENWTPEPDSIDWSSLSIEELREQKEKMSEIISNLKGEGSYKLYGPDDLSRAQTIVGKASHMIRKRKNAGSFELSSVGHDALDIVEDSEKQEQFKTWVKSQDVPVQNRALKQIDRAVTRLENEGSGLSSEAYELSEVAEELRDELKDQKERWVTDKAEDVLDPEDEKRLVRKVQRKAENFDLDTGPHPTGNALEGDSLMEVKGALEEAKENKPDVVADALEKQWENGFVEEFHNELEKEYWRRNPDRFPDGPRKKMLMKEIENDGEINGEFVQERDFRANLAVEMTDIRQRLPDVDESDVDLDWKDIAADYRGVDRSDISEDDIEDHVIQLYKQDAREKRQGKVFEEMKEDMEQIRDELKSGSEKYPMPMQQGNMETETGAELDPDYFEETADDMWSIADDSLLPDADEDELDSIIYGHDKATEETTAGYFSPGRRYLHLEQHSDSTAWHEFGHTVGQLNRRANNAAKEFMMRRLEGETVHDLNASDDAIGNGDDFWRSYVGRIYSEQLTPGDKITRDKIDAIDATEVLSTGVERMRSTEEMVKFYNDDPEHFAFTVSVLKGRFGFRSDFSERWFKDD